MASLPQPSQSRHVCLHSYGSTPRDTSHTGCDVNGFSGSYKEALNGTLPSFKHQVKYILLHSVFPEQCRWHESLLPCIPTACALQQDTSCLVVAVSCEQLIFPTRLSSLTFFKESWAPLKIPSQIQTLEFHVQFQEIHGFPKVYS